MKKINTLLLSIFAVLVVLILGVNSLANVPGEPALTNSSFSEPLNILFIGFGLIAFGTILKNRSSRNE